MALTTKKITTGEFNVLWNGEATGWMIYNGSRGLTGRDTRNVYGIAKGDFFKPVGSLSDCKRLLTVKLAGKIN